MGSQLQQALRNLCLDIGWKYAIFWKLKHRSETTLLSWEDTYYDNDDYQQSGCPLNSVANMGCQLSSNDALGFAVAEMSHHVYTMGEGVVGHVASTGKHLWISTDKCVIDSSFFFQCFEGWQSQYSAGIKTIAVVAVVPHGVIQLGSLDEIPEDLMIVGKVREAISVLQDSILASQAIMSLPSHMKSSCLVVFPPVEDNDSKGQISRLQNLGELSKNMVTTPPMIDRSNSSLSDSVIRFENSRMLSSCHSSEILDSISRDCGRDMVCDLANVKDSFYTFSSGYELSEALGPGFRNPQAHLDWGSGNVGTDNEAGMSEGMGTSSLLTENSDTGHLLEAVVANPSKHHVDKKNYILNRENISEPCSSVGSLNSVGCYSLDHETINSLNSSGSFAVRYSKGFSSTSCSRGSKNSGRSQESGIHKKRARPGESSRPRPRDRQLIQDRIKELRDLVPNGSKCSIDSLLKQTIKHMIFMQTITKQAENLNKCIKPKEPHLEASLCTEQGSSWAVEVDNLKACPIIVENINMHGQILVEMVCNDGSHFLEISEAIHSMGLTILKGVADSYGEKTWIQFVVQDEKNRSLRRMDILWSLIQLLQTKMNI